ncbi:hypothetical protein C7E17_25325, partial [Stenotrophomonas maltophilia]
IRGLAAALATALLSVGADASASGARQGVKAQPGEIVLLRDVSARRPIAWHHRAFAAWPQRWQQPCCRLAPTRPRRAPARA